MFVAAFRIYPYDEDGKPSVLGDAPLSAQVTPPAGEKIGQVVFPVSCAPAMQKPFERAVALLHSFWYLESAKAFAADAFPRIGAAAIQVFGGVGFTWEHDVHLFYKRLLTLQEAYGDANDFLEELAGLVL